MLRNIVFSVVILFTTTALIAQSYSGPAAGSKTGGVLVTTDSYGMVPTGVPPKPETIKNKFSYKPEPVYIEAYQGMYDPMKFYFEDKNAGVESIDTTHAVLTKNFQGLTQTNSIPPDPYVAVGAGYIVAQVNSDFGIFDMNGNLIKRINADQWFGTTIQNPGAFDPKIFYDHYDKRWVQVWLDQRDSPARGFLLFSVSEDSIPLGRWYNFAIPTDVNGNAPSGSWMDYQGVGFDDDCIYITGSQFTFSSTFQYSKIRIFPKAPFYSNDVNATITWNDLYDIKYPSPGPTNQRIFHLRPTVSYTHDPSKYYFLYVPGGSNFMALYWVENPLTAPVLKGTTVPTMSYQSPPNANQLGGGSPALSVNDGELRFEPIFRDGYIWAMHSIKNPSSAANSALHYVKINTTSKTLEEQAVLGAPGYWYFFPALAVDKYQNVAATFARSANTEYVGAFYSSKAVGETGFEYSAPLQTGKANYVKTFGTTRNRWGDYMGIWLDPRTETEFVLFTEYASALNTWSTWAGILRVEPYDGTVAFIDKTALNFGEVERQTTSHTETFTITSFGTDPLVITDMHFNTNNFRINTTISYPFTLDPNRAMDIELTAVPEDLGVISDTLVVVSNNNEVLQVPLTLTGYDIIPTEEKAMFALSGGNADNKLFYLRTGNGVPTEIGATNINSMLSIAVNPKTKVIYGLRNANPMEIVRVNSSGGDAHTLFKASVTELTSIAFDTSGNLYASAKNGKIFAVSLTDSSMVEKVTSQAATQSIAFHPQTNELYASLFRAIGSPKDVIFKINLTNGDTTKLGQTGFGVVTTDLEFDDQGILYGLKAATNQPADLVTLNLNTGAGTVVGSTGVVGMVSLSFNYNGTVTDVKTPTTLPVAFSLGQNYPNPFNPITKIDYSLPQAANVKITVYNLLGEVVKVLFDGFNEAGTYSTYWNADDAGGQKLTSGIYFYELKATTLSEQHFSDIKKMILLK